MDISKSLAKLVLPAALLAGGSDLSSELKAGESKEPQKTMNAGEFFFGKGSKERLAKLDKILEKEAAIAIKKLEDSFVVTEDGLTYSEFKEQFKQRKEELSQDKKELAQDKKELHARQKSLADKYKMFTTLYKNPRQGEQLVNFAISSLNEDETPHMAYAVLATINNLKEPNVTQEQKLAVLQAVQENFPQVFEQWLTIIDDPRLSGEALAQLK